MSDIVQIVDAFARAYGPWTRAVECVAVGRYALAARAARLSSVRSPAIEFAFAAYSPGEFYRAPLGATADRITMGVSLDTRE